MVHDPCVRVGPEGETQRCRKRSSFQAPRGEVLGTALPLCLMMGWSLGVSKAHREKTWARSGGEQERMELRGKARIHSCLLLTSMLWVTLEKDLMPFATELNVDLVQDLRNRGRSSGGSPKSCSHRCSSKSRSAARTVPRCIRCNSAWCPVRSIMAAASHPPSPSHACSSSGYP